MTVTTETYWSVNGVPLNTLAYNVTTWGGDLQAPPPLRGEDLTIPYRPGQVLQSRRPDGRSLSFSMWVLGADEDGNVPENKTMRAEFEKNFKMLRNLFWNQGRPVSITKRWRDYDTGALQTATATGIFSNGLAPTMNGGLRASFSVDFFLPDPFFYGPEVTVNFAATSTSNQTFTVLGDFETTVVLLTVNGARTNFRWTNNTESVYVNVSGVFATGASAWIDVDNWQARRNPSAENTTLIASVTHLGHPFWFVLRPGPQNVSLSSSSGTGTGVLKYRPRWL
jgi:hypothetical protein